MPYSVDQGSLKDHNCKQKDCPYLPLLRDGEILEQPVDPETLTEKYVEEAKGLDMLESLPNVTFRGMCQARPGVRRLRSSAGSSHQKSHLAECTVTLKVSAHESMCSCQQAGAQQHVC